MQVDDSSIRLFVRQRPEAFEAVASGGDIELTTASPLQVTARCKVGDATYTPPPPGPAQYVDPRLAPWKLGFMQVQILEIAWSYYRGVQDNDGCVLNDLAGQRSLTVCRDYDRGNGTIWYECSNNVADCYGMPDPSTRPPWNLEFYFGDNPRNPVPARVHNGQTQRANYLHEVRFAAAFVTTLTEQVTPGVYKHHRHFLWSYIWHLRFTSTPPLRQRTDFVRLPGTGFWISEFKRGGPTDLRYMAALNDSRLTPSCTEVARQAPVARSTSSRWQRFPLMDRKDTMF